MSAKTTGTIWDLDISVPWRMVLLAMVDHADHNGEHMRASQAFIAWKTGYSSRNVARIIQELMQEGLLILTDESIGEENEYRIDLSVAPFKPKFQGRKPKKTLTTPDKMSGVKRGTPDILSGVNNGTHANMSGVVPETGKTPDNMSPPHANMSGGTHDMLAIDRDQYHIESHDHGSSGSSARAILRDCGLFNGTIRQIMALGIDTPTLIASVRNLADAGWGAGAIANELRDNPPVKGQPYDKPEQSRSVNAPDRGKPSERIGERPALPAGLKIAGRKPAESGD